MRWKIIRWLFLTVIRCTIGTPSSAGEPPKWKEEWQKTIEAAKKDGQLSLYGGQEITHPDILAAFNKEFPFIKLVTVTGRWW